MKISTRLRIAQLCCLVLMLLMAAIFTMTTVAMRHEVAKAELTGEVLRAAHGLRYLSLEYVMHHETRSRLQWLQRHRSLDRLLAGADGFDTADELALLAELRGHQESIGALFDELQGLPDELRRAPARRQILQELEARLTGLVMHRAQNMMSNAEELTRLSSRHILAAQNRAMLAAGALGALVLVVVVGAMGLTIRSVTGPLTRLHKATEVVGGGSLDFVLHPHSNDEIGSLALAFNQMVERLQANHGLAQRAAAGEPGAATGDGRAPRRRGQGAGATEPHESAPADHPFDRRAAGLAQHLPGGDPQPGRPAAGRLRRHLHARRWRAGGQLRRRAQLRPVDGAGDGRGGPHPDRPQRPVALRGRAAGLRGRHRRGRLPRFRNAWPRPAWRRWCWRRCWPKAPCSAC